MDVSDRLSFSQSSIDLLGTRLCQLEGLARIGFIMLGREGKALQRFDTEICRARSVP